MWKITREEHSPESACAPFSAAAVRRRPDVRSLLRHYVFVDCATQGYLVLVGLIVLCFHGRAVPHWPAMLGAHVLVIGLIHALIQLHEARPNNRGLDLLRHFYPMLLYTGLYRETGLLNHMLIPGFLDPGFIRLETQIFGTQPSLVFMEKLPYLPVSELFYFSYFSYYLMIGGIGLALFRQDRRHFFHYLSILSFVFYACFLIYIFLPVIGPRIFFRELGGYHLPSSLLPAGPLTFPAAIQAGPFYRIMAWIYHRFESAGAAFPSSHVAIAITTLCFSFRYLRPIRWPHFVMVILLCVSTVYCRYHYVVDVLGGGLAAAALIPLGTKLYFLFQSTSGSGKPPNGASRHG